jgi:hypothetical protein
MDEQLGMTRLAASSSTKCKPLVHRLDINVPDERQDCILAQCRRLVSDFTSSPSRPIKMCVTSATGILARAAHYMPHPMYLK